MDNEKLGVEQNEAVFSGMGEADFEQNLKPAKKTIDKIGQLAGRSTGEDAGTETAEANEMGVNVGGTDSLLPPGMEEISEEADEDSIDMDDFTDATNMAEVRQRRELRERQIREIVAIEEKCGDDMHKLAVAVQDASDTAILNLFGRVRDGEGKR